jgi:hypothetical protein
MLRRGREGEKAARTYTSRSGKSGDRGIRRPPRREAPSREDGIAEHASPDAVYHDG